MSEAAEREAFEAWWEREGQFGRAGGGDYEKTFAYAAWQERARRAPTSEPAPVAAEPKMPMFAVGVARRKWESLQSDGYRMQSIRFEGNNRAGTIDPWGKVLWGATPAAAMPAESSAEAKDAARYRWLRKQNWHSGAFCVVQNPKESVKLGYACPSGEHLDAVVDAAMPAEPGEKP